MLAFTLVVALVAACAEGARVESPPRASSAPAVPMSQPSAQLVQPAVSAAPEPAPAPAEDGGAGDGGVLFPDADEVLLGLRDTFRACYNSALRGDPTLRGRVLFSLTVAPSGDVTEIRAAMIRGLSTELVACLARVCRGARFTSQSATPAILNIPITLLTPP